MISAMKNLVVYEHAVQLVIKIRVFIESHRDTIRSFDVQDQIRRSSLSVALNIAEGSGLPSKWFQKYLFIAGASANETCALLDIIKKVYEIETEDLQNEYVYLGKQITTLRKRLNQPFF